MIYDDASISKLQSVKENRGKSGVYRWINKASGKSYVGSSVDLGQRFSNCYKFSYITDPKRNMLIHKALIKYGYSIFKLEILEYCEPTLAVQREQYYLDLLQPEYNTLKIAGSSLGFKHSELTMTKFRNRELTSEQKDRLKKHLASHNASKEQIDKSRERLLELNALKGISVEVFDMETSETSVYLSTRQAAEAIGCVHRTIALANKAFREKGVYRPIKGRYVVKIIQDNNSAKGETLSPSSTPSEVMPPYSSPSKADVLSKDITPQTIASVIMGDGYFADGSVKICTDNFTEQEVLDLIQVLLDKFAIKATANKRTNLNGKVWWRIRISKSSMEKLKLLVGPYMIAEMLYKLGIKK